MTEDTTTQENTIFRQESFVSDADLRVDVAREISETSGDEEVVTLASKSVHVRGDYVIRRGRRSREIAGSYERTVEHADTFQVGGAIEERVTGGVNLNVLRETETIMAGAYVNTIAGAYLRMSAWVDFLAWGGWLEADAARIEIAGMAIRSYMGYAHAAGARVMLASALVDDYVQRTETFGVMTDNLVSETHVGSPGSGEILEA